MGVWNSDYITMELYIAPTSNRARDWYKGAVDSYMAKPYEQRDAGLDTFCNTSVVGKPGATEKLDLSTRAAAYDPQRGMFRAFLLMPRSSISKTPMRMANSVGLIDAGYRGILLGAVDFQQEFTAGAGERYFQIVGADLLPWKAIHIVEEIPGGATLRGEGGFGSTGRGCSVQGAEPLFAVAGSELKHDASASASAGATAPVQLSPGSYFSQ
jgi:dUTP pyrophosphatase